jgi:four helix bundle protein
MNPISSSSGTAISGYRDLELWKSAMELALSVLKLADGPLLGRRRSLCDQISRAAVSIPSNIAEGNERGTNRDSIRFLYIARGSAAELSTQLELAFGIGAMTPTEHADLQAQLSKVFRILGGMLKMRQARLNTEKQPK